MSDSPTRAPGRCPTCRGPRALPAANPTFPFCSPRCRAADLGKWLAGDYVISTPLPDEADEYVPTDDD
ncbi:MAG TPA: DNA gyrase inhibitor YacG [Myxococcota bacterium]|nr:DNA gyrase inhibitor YacG [Myxococcota bacterium]